MLHLNFVLKGHFNHNLQRNISRNLIKLSSKLIWSALMAASTAIPSLSAHADTNVMGEEIIIYSDDGYKPAPRDLGVIDKSTNEKTTSDKSSSDKTITKKLGGNRLGDSFDTELHTNDTDTQEPIAVNNDDLWQRIRNGYAIPDSTSSLVARHEEWYSTRPDYIKRMVERSQKYLFHIVEEVEKRGMPTEIALLPMIESAYNPQANSTSSASGIWQFVPATGKHFGLKQNWWVDNRRNVTFATDAALTYLQKLYNMFGAWDLALAAYNAGEGTVGRAIERNRKLGLPTDYESLDLPAETKNYVPKLQAIKNLMTNPENYGLKIQTIANTPYFAKVTAPAQIDAHLAAKLAEISDDEFLALNPSNKRPVITSNGEKHELLLPILSAQTFRNNLAGYDKPLVSWRTYFAKRGERMESIASKFGMQLSQLRIVNNLPSQNKIKNSSTILVPNGNKTDFSTAKPITKTNDAEVAPALENNDEINAKQGSANIDINNTETPVENNADKIEPVKQVSVTHKVKKGENIQTIAKHYGISVKQIMAANSLRNYKLKAGQTIKIGSETVSEQSSKKTSSGKSNDKNTEKTLGKKSNAKSKTVKRSETSIKNKAKNKSKASTKRVKQHK
ncbi:transglycosylase SLT domain-containing protein [Methylotenera versatilis]|uniref:Lytic transglycosylase catalytic n=1 Tax=Methylotenera versatilis (strain 301) TaxID=666681 RepID=D7DIL9_METV0|nr:transglycosylase SLT domain-containing protein [Methylotenera versatilis]ADI29904.1 Lytic transglycosylase catalytic [Methylotenera versatilis 301]